jgi:hypothetical protein
MPEGYKYAKARAASSVSMPAAKKMTRKRAAAKKSAEKMTGKERALSNPGASKRSEQATAMLRKHAPAIKKMAAGRKKKG